MGRRSHEKMCCKVVLSVTNAFLEKIKSAVKNARVDKIISDKTYGCAKVISERWNDDGGFMGNLRNGMNNMGPVGVFFQASGLGAAVNLSWTHVTIEYRIKVDMYHLVRHKKGRLISQIIKRFPKLRRKLVYKEMVKEIRKGFEDKISDKAGFFSGVSGAAVTVKDIEVYRVV